MPLSTDSSELVGLIQELAKTRAAKQQRIDEGNGEGALILRGREKELLREMARLRALK